jgi:hypothetical protein
MTDTRRTYDELIDIYEDNISEAISAQDGRDLVKSTHPEKGGHANGYGGYADVGTSVTPITLLADTKTVLTNDAANTAIADERLLPTHTLPYWDTNTNRFDLVQFPVQTMMLVRADFIITTTGANADLRIGSDFYNSSDVYVFTASRFLGTFKNAGTYAETQQYMFYLGAPIFEGNFDIWLECTNLSTVQVIGFNLFAWTGSHD